MAAQKASEGTTVSAVRGGMSKARAARTFDVGPTSVGRCVDKARQGESRVSGSEEEPRLSSEAGR